ncbi:MAG: hypothetical protein KC620_09875 [Myxococcales bacterium]|nr:hypothetical protein [Myxococcales bacterium]
MLRPIVFGLLAFGCGGLSFQNPECARRYDACTDRCADRCEPPRASFDPHGDTDDALETWGPDCHACVDNCRSDADQCEDRPRAMP